MKRIRLYSAVGLSVVCMWACGRNGQHAEHMPEPANDSTGKVCLAPSDRNPNGASELAQLMRTMETQAETWKKEISENKAALTPVPDVYQTLKTARPTDPAMKNENYDAFADDFLNFSAALTKASKTERRPAFNAMVGGCMNCHSQMCPGPVKRIKKFYFE